MHFSKNIPKEERRVQVQIILEPFGLNKVKKYIFFAPGFLSAFNMLMLGIPDGERHFRAIPKSIWALMPCWHYMGIMYMGHWESTTLLVFKQKKIIYIRNTNCIVVFMMHQTIINWEIQLRVIKNHEEVLKKVT